MTTPVLTLTDDPPPGAENAIGAALDLFNQSRTGVVHARPLAVLIEAAGPGEGGGHERRVAGGIVGRTSLGLLFVDLVFVPEEFRGQRLGTRAMRMAEDEAVRRGCTQAVLMTIAFQAPDFYRRLGYAEFGRTDAADPTHARVFMKKNLAAPPRSG